MAVDPKFVILKSTNWLPATEESLLGTVVKNILSPTDDYVPNNAHHLYGKNVVEHKYDNFVLRTGKGSKRFGKLELTKMLGFQWIGAEGADFNLSGKLLRYKRITQYDTFYKKLVKEKRFKEEVPKWFRFRGPPVCVVMGLFICEDVDIATNQEEFDKLEANGQAPLGIVLSSAAGVPVHGGDVSASGGKEDKKLTYFKAKVGVESIFAIELKILKKKGDKIVPTNENPKPPPGRQLASHDGEELEVDDLELQDLNDDEWDGDWENMFE